MKPSAAIDDKTPAEPVMTVLPVMVVNDVLGRPVYVNLTALALDGETWARVDGVEDHQTGLSLPLSLERLRH